MGTAPTSATGETEFCCTWDFFHCGVDNWCNENDSNCHGGCGGVWMELNSEAMSCLALHEECTSDINDFSVNNQVVLEMIVTNNAYGMRVMELARTSYKYWRSVDICFLMNSRL